MASRISRLRSLRGAQFRSFSNKNMLVKRLWSWTTNLAAGRWMPSRMLMSLIRYGSHTIRQIWLQKQEAKLYYKYVLSACELLRVIVEITHVTQTFLSSLCSVFPAEPQSPLSTANHPSTIVTVNYVHEIRSTDQTNLPNRAYTDDKLWTSLYEENGWNAKRKQ